MPSRRSILMRGQISTLIPRESLHLQAAPHCRYHVLLQLPVPPTGACATPSQYFGTGNHLAPSRALAVICGGTVVGHGEATCCVQGLVDMAAVAGSAVELPRAAGASATVWVLRRGLGVLMVVDCGPELLFLDGVISSLHIFGV